MNIRETVELDEKRITVESQTFAAALFARFPKFSPYAAMEQLQGTERWNLVATIPAPSRDPKATLIVWVDGGDEPSVAFGSWHTHGGLWITGTDDQLSHLAILDLIEGILNDRFILCEDVGGAGDGRATILDLSTEDTLLEELTSKYSPGRARLRSWSGRLDRIVDINGLDQDKPV